MNRVVHFEIHATNADAMQQFYQTVFGWKIVDLGPNMGNYRTVDTGESPTGAKWPGINGGLMPRHGNPAADGQPVNAFVCTISVDALDVYIEKVLSAGGSMALAKFEVPGVGSMAYCKDPDGNIFGMLQPV